MGSFQNKFLIKVGNLAQPAWPPPLPERWDFFREFVGKFWQKMVKYAIKTVIYKSWDWVRPPSPSLGQIPNFYRKFVLGAPLRLSLMGFRLREVLEQHTVLQGWFQPIITSPPDFFAWTLMSQPYMLGNGSASIISSGTLWDPLEESQRVPEFTPSSCVSLGKIETYTGKYRPLYLCIRPT